MFTSRPSCIFYVSLVDWDDGGDVWCPFLVWLVSRPVNYSISSNNNNNSSSIYSVILVQSCACAIIKLLTLTHLLPLQAVSVLIFPHMYTCITYKWNIAQLTTSLNIMQLISWTVHVNHLKNQEMLLYNCVQGSTNRRAPGCVNAAGKLRHKW